MSGGEKGHSDRAQTGREFLTLIVLLRWANMYGMSTDLTFITNESGQTLQNRFGDLLRGHTRFFDCLVGYFYVSGFFRIYRSLERTEKVRILIGLSTDRTTFIPLRKIIE